MSDDGKESESLDDRDDDGIGDDPLDPLGPVEFDGFPDLGGIDIGPEMFHFCYQTDTHSVTKEFGGDTVTYRVLLERFREFMLDCGYSQEVVNRIVILDA